MSPEDDEKATRERYALGPRGKRVTVEAALERAERAEAEASTLRSERAERDEEVAALRVRVAVLERDVLALTGPVTPEAPERLVPDSIGRDCASDSRGH